MKPDRWALVVDDSKTARVFLRDCARAAGFRVLEARSGSEALMTIEASRHLDVALVDWNMPEMTGIELIREVRRRGFDTLPFMVVTTESSLDKVQQALATGAGEYLMKPYDVDMLRSKLEQMGFESVE